MSDERILTDDARVEVVKILVDPEEQSTTLPTDIDVYRRDVPPKPTEENIRVTIGEIVESMQEEGHEIPEALARPEPEITTVIKDADVVAGARRTIRHYQRLETLDYEVLTHPELRGDLVIEEGLPVTGLFQADWDYKFLGDAEARLKIASQKVTLRYELDVDDKEGVVVKSKNDADIDVNVPRNLKVSGDLVFYAQGEFFPRLKLGFEIFNNRKIFSYKPHLSGEIGDKTKPAASWKWSPF